VKQRLQVQGSIQNAEFKNTFHAAKVIFQREGWKGMFASVNSAILRDAPFAAIYFSGYESFKKMLRDRKKDGTLHSGSYLLSGACAGGVAAALTNPLDVLKTRLQTQAALGTLRYSGFLHAVRTIFQEEGVRGFTRGIGARIVYITPAAAIIFASYEQYKRLFARIWPL